MFQFNETFTHSCHFWQTFFLFSLSLPIFTALSLGCVFCIWAQKNKFFLSLPLEYFLGPGVIKSIAASHLTVSTFAFLSSCVCVCACAIFSVWTWIFSYFFYTFFSFSPLPPCLSLSSSSFFLSSGSQWAFRVCVLFGQFLFFLVLQENARRLKIWGIHDDANCTFVVLYCYYQSCIIDTEIEEGRESGRGMGIENVHLRLYWGGKMTFSCLYKILFYGDFFLSFFLFFLSSFLPSSSVVLSINFCFFFSLTLHSFLLILLPVWSFLKFFYHFCLPPPFSSPSYSFSVHLSLWDLRLTGQGF